MIAVHVADALVNGRPERDIDVPRLLEMGLAERLAGWKTLHEARQSEEAS